MSWERDKLFMLVSLCLRIVFFFASQVVLTYKPIIFFNRPLFPFHFDLIMY